MNNQIKNEDECNPLPVCKNCIPTPLLVTLLAATINKTIIVKCPQCNDNIIVYPFP